jgi:hypothetical protein
MKPEKFFKAFLVFILIIAPIIIYFFLSKYGYLGEDFTNTLLYKVILVILGVFVLIMGFIWQPFFYWRRLFKPMGPKSDIIKSGKSASGVIKKMGKRSKDFLIIHKKPYFSIPLEMEIKMEETSYTVNIEAFIPVAEFPQLKTDTEVPVKINKDNPEEVAIDWDNL